MSTRVVRHGGFHNFMSYERGWLDSMGSEDSIGQAVLGLAEVLGSGLPDSLRAVARELIDAALPILAESRSLRAQAYVILAWAHFASAGVNDIRPLENISWRAAHRLLDCFDRCRQPDWQWFEPQMTYANAVLPHALFAAARPLVPSRISGCRSRNRSIFSIATTTGRIVLADWQPRLVFTRARQSGI